MVAAGNYITSVVITCISQSRRCPDAGKGHNHLLFSVEFSLFQYSCRGVFFFFLPTHPSFSTAVPAAGKFKPDGFEDNDRRECNVCVMCQQCSCADHCCCAFQRDETCWTLPGVSPHRLFLEMAHWVHCATISTCCCALHFFPLYGDEVFKVFAFLLKR